MTVSLAAAYAPRSTGMPAHMDATLNLLAAILRDPTGLGATWMLDALCAQVDTGDVFFPDQGGSVQHALNICALCDVRDDCLAWALEVPESLDGLWGGVPERTRQRMRGARFRHNHPDNVRDNVRPVAAGERGDLPGGLADELADGMADADDLTDPGVEVAA